MRERNVIIKTNPGLNGRFLRIITRNNEMCLNKIWASCKGILKDSDLLQFEKNLNLEIQVNLQAIHMDFQMPAELSTTSYRSSLRL